MVKSRIFLRLSHQKENDMNKIYFLGILILSVLVISCEKEPLTVGDAIDLGELEGTNYVQINDESEDNG